MGCGSSKAVVVDELDERVDGAVTQASEAGTSATSAAGAVAASAQAATEGAEQAAKEASGGLQFAVGDVSDFGDKTVTARMPRLSSAGRLKPVMSSEALEAKLKAAEDRRQQQIEDQKNKLSAAANKRKENVERASEEVEKKAQKTAQKLTQDLEAKASKRDQEIQGRVTALKERDEASEKVRSSKASRHLHSALQAAADMEWGGEDDEAASGLPDDDDDGDETSDVAHF